MLHVFFYFGDCFWDIRFYQYRIFKQQPATYNIEDTKYI